MSRALWAIAGVSILAATATGVGVRAVSQDRRLRNISEATGVPLDVLAAFSAVESAGDDSAVRFECHRWNRRRGSLPAVPCTASSRGPWSTVREQTDRAAAYRAATMSPRLAVEVSSWGRWQVMGTTGLAVTGWTPEQFLEAFELDPATVGDELVIGWFNRNPAAVRAAQRRDLLGLARLYNGPGQAEHYAGLMAEAMGADRA